MGLLDNDVCGAGQARGPVGRGELKFHIGVIQQDEVELHGRVLGSNQCLVT